MVTFDTFSRVNFGKYIVSCIIGWSRDDNIFLDENETIHILVGKNYIHIKHDPSSCRNYRVYNGTVDSYTYLNFQYLHDYYGNG